MKAAEVMSRMLEELHRSFRYEVRNLAPDQLTFRASPDANSVIFLFWHWTRFDDNLMHRHFGGTPLWREENWYEKFGLAPEDAGTGFTSERVGRFNPLLTDAMDYFHRVWEFAAPLMKDASDELLARILDEQRPENTVASNIETFLIGHGFYHLGEIRFIKGLLGVPFMR